jgi:uncharacterized damage-inducible protein DinB
MPESGGSAGGVDSRDPQWRSMVEMVEHARDPGIEDEVGMTEPHGPEPGDTEPGDTGSGAPGDPGSGAPGDPGSGAPGGVVVLPPFPSPTQAVASRAEVFLRYLDFFRDVVVAKVSGLPESDLRGSRVPSGWTLLELVRHLRYVERRWLEWGFEGHDVPDPWGDRREDRWYVAPEEAAGLVIAELVAQGERTRAIIQAHDLDEVGAPGPRWDGEPPATLERVLFHLVQEYARHAGQLDVVRELVDGEIGE